MNLETKKASARAASVADAIPTEAPEIPQAPKTPAVGVPTKDEAPPVHVHKASVCEYIAGHDAETGRRIVRLTEGRKPTYVHNCKACIADDLKRRTEPPTLTAEEIACTLFLVPESQYDQRVAKTYMQVRYPDAVAVAHQFHAEKLSYVPGAQIVVITRRPAPGKDLGPSTRRRMDAEGVWQTMEIPPEEYLGDIVESRPISIAECMGVQPATMFSEQLVDMTELVAQLSEVAHPYKIAVPASDKDRLYVMRANA